MRRSDRRLRDALERRLGVGVRGVLQRDDGGRGIRIVIAHASDERRERTGRRVVDGGEMGFHIQRLRTDAGEADGAHVWSPPASWSRMWPATETMTGMPDATAFGDPGRFTMSALRRHPREPSREHSGRFLGGAAAAEFLGDAGNLSLHHALGALGRLIAGRESGATGRHDEGETSIQRIAKRRFDAVCPIGDDDGVTAVVARRAQSLDAHRPTRIGARTRG